MLIKTVTSTDRLNAREFQIAKYKQRINHTIQSVTKFEQNRKMPKRSIQVETKKQAKIKKTTESGDGCAHPFNLTSLGFSTDNELIRVCNLCHHTWPELCSNNSKIVLRKETKDGPHVGRQVGVFCLELLNRTKIDHKLCSNRTKKWPLVYKHVL